jgi:hypothetical protein
MIDTDHLFDAALLSAFAGHRRILSGHGLRSGSNATAKLAIASRNEISAL